MSGGMKLVLLPGMDGTGVLFGPLLHKLGGLDMEVIPLPSEGEQDYASLAGYVAARIKDRDCVVIAESFSGGIAEALLRDRNLNIRHTIFVASFLTSPSRLLSRVAAVLPIRALVAIPILAPLILRVFLLGRTATPETIALFRKAIGLVPPNTLRARLRQMASYRSAGHVFETDATYIHPTRDFLVGDRKAEFRAVFPKLKLVEVKGPHFILQAEPGACAKHILAAVGHLISKGEATPSASLL